MRIPAEPQRPHSRTGRTPPQARRLLHGILLIACGIGASAGCAVRGGPADRYPELVEYEGRRISDVDYLGAEPFHEDSLLSITETRESRCSFLGIPICVPFTSIGREEHELDVGTVAADVRRLELFYRGQGYFGTAVSPRVEEDGEDVRVIFDVVRADAVLLDSLTVAGTEPAFAPDSILPVLPLQPGDTFRLPAFVAAADTVGGALRALGHAYAQVLRNYGVDTVANKAVATLEAIPGPRVEVDTIIVTGAENLGVAATRRQLAFREGDVLRRSQLLQSQRNLYSLELVQFASVTLAPDSLQRIPGDSTQATVIVSVAEAPVQQVDAALGYGTVECARAEARWVHRSFGGGARRLAVSGSVSKIGVALQSVKNSVCGAFEGDSAIAAGLDYRFTATLSQPYFLSPLNRITATLYADRVSEPHVYQREAEGGQTSIARRLGENTLVSQDVEIVRAKTIASPALYCIAFQVCEPETIDLLSRSRWSNTLGVSFTTDQTDFPINPTRGYRVNSSFAWATPLLGSDVRYLRLTGDASLVRTLRPGWIGAAALRIGNFFSTASLDPNRNFLPPEERFYAGGQSSVRGFTRNALGPGVYVTSELTEEGLPDSTAAEFIPVGGTALTVASVEVRFPSPFLPRLVRLASFIDAGNVGFGNFWDLERGSWRVTPGVGLRLTTPVGPVRVDIGYNPHGPRTEPLYYADPNARNLVKVREHFTPPPPTFWNRLRVHLAVGQAF